jgi:hypothetical protein
MYPRGSSHRLPERCALAFHNRDPLFFIHALRTSQPTKENTCSIYNYWSAALFFFCWSGEIGLGSRSLCVTGTLLSDHMPRPTIDSRGFATAKIPEIPYWTKSRCGRCFGPDDRCMHKRILLGPSPLFMTLLVECWGYHSARTDAGVLCSGVLSRPHISWTGIPLLSFQARNVNH